MESQITFNELMPRELKKRMDEADDLVILDVREPHELAICSLANTVHIPLGQLPFRLSELEKYRNSEIVVYCRSGKRSASACQLLARSGFASVANLTGGILAWADDVDPTVAKY